MPDVLNRLRQALGVRYLVEETLGTGAMSLVYRARDTRYDRPVAVKVLKPELANTLGTDRFLREIQIAAKLQHPNILPLLDSGEFDRIPFYVMPLVEGESLKDRLLRERQLVIEDAVRIAREVAEALEYAHGRGVIHRDVKPGNILLSSGRAVLVDFGIAKALAEAGGSRLTSSGLTVGTPAYMSPEQQSGEDESIDGRSDLYSLGCVLFEMLAGDPAFSGERPEVVLARKLLPPPSLRAIRDPVPESLDRTVGRALATAPPDRFANAGEFISALESTASRVWLPFSVPLRAIRAAAAGAIVALAAIGGWFVLREPDVTLDPNKIVVFPLLEQGSATETAGAGLDAAIMIGAALVHTEPLKWIDGWRHLGARERADPSLVTGNRARAISMDRRAAYYIDGAVRNQRGFSTVFLRLYDVVGDSVIRHESRTAPSDSVPISRLGLEAMTGLLPPLLDPNRDIDLALLTDRDAGAVALFIQGERAYRSSRFGEALGLYRRAVEEDSGFAFAAMKGAQAASWESLLTDATGLITLAVANAPLLPTRYESFAHGLRAYLLGEADSAVARLERAITEDPEWGEAHMALGEVYYHLLPARAPLDSLAEAAFRAAFQSDSAFSPPLFHLIQIAARDGDVERAEALLSRYRASSPGSAYLAQVSLVVQCVAGQLSEADWEREAATDPSVILGAAKALATAGAQPACAEAAYRAVLAAQDISPGHMWGSSFGLGALLVAQRRDYEARTVYDAALSSGLGGVRYLYILGALAGADLADAAESVEAYARDRFGVDFARASARTRFFQGQWHALLGDSRQVSRIQQSLAILASETGERTTRLYSDALAAHLADMRGDSEDAVSRFAALTPVGDRNALSWALGEPLAYEQIRRSQLLLEQERFEEAHRVATMFDHSGPAVLLQFLPASLLTRLRAAQALGRSDLVERYRERLRTLDRYDLIEIAAFTESQRR